MEAGAGIITPPASVSFQIALTPSVFQTGQVAELISRAAISGQDNWTKAALTAASHSIDTTLPDDPAVTRDQGVVQ